MKVAIEMISIAFIFSLSLKEAFCEQKNSYYIFSGIRVLIHSYLFYPDSFLAKITLGSTTPGTGS